ncbi:hypothetical protein MRB53_041290 [Persea americana]|nr:hypothetical protein MRB53_041290 [Persea americana]
MWPVEDCVLPSRLFNCQPCRPSSQSPSHLRHRSMTENQAMMSNRVLSEGDAAPVSDESAEGIHHEGSTIRPHRSTGAFTSQIAPNGALHDSVPDALHRSRMDLPSSYPPLPPTWQNLPNKGQLAILTLSRFVDFFQMAALQTYMVHQLKSFNPQLPDLVISHQAGVLQGAFTAAQIITSILWGRAADYPSVGRKSVLNIGLVGTAIGCVGVGFSKTYGQAVFWRLLSGAINGTVGSARTMASLRLLWAMPWIKSYPFAIANLLSSVLLLAEAVLVQVALKETLSTTSGRAHQQPNLLQSFRSGWQELRRLQRRGYRLVKNQVQGNGDLLSQVDGEFHNDVELDDLKFASSEPQRLPFRRIWTTNVLWTLLSVAIFDFHMGAFANLWILFLATPRKFAHTTAQDIGSIATRFLRPRDDLLKFSSGLAFPPATIGVAMAIIGFIGVALQFLLYPWANARFGLMRCFRLSLVLFPIAYALAPYLALLPSSTPAPGPATGVAIWFGISVILFLQVAARTFALPASIILVNNCCPHPSVLGTIHGLGNACSAAFRTFGPIFAGYTFGIWTERGIVGMAWWLVAAVAAAGCVASYWVKNGDGHEVLLPGEDVEAGIK